MTWTKLQDGTDIFTADGINDIVACMEKQPKEKHSCLYCGGFTFDDERGNCCACGAPRAEECMETFEERYGITKVRGCSLSTTATPMISMPINNGAYIIPGEYVIEDY